MDKNNTRLQDVFIKYTDKIASPDELNELWDYLEDPLFTEDIKELIGKSYFSDHNETGLSADQNAAVLKNIFESDRIHEPKRTSLWQRLAIAAAVATIIFGAGLIYFNQNNKQYNQAVSQNDVAPGKAGATLTLANGKKIRLNEVANGELAREAGVVISKSVTGQLIYNIKSSEIESDKTNTLSTANGETYQVRLPDGSRVWLNAASSLKYPASFAKLKDRRVELSGEGYFEVAKDRAHPFIVETGDQQVQVLGTHFNINAYADESDIATTLLEGSVKLIVGNRDQLLKPGEQGLNDHQDIKVGKANIDAIVDWKNEEFFLDKMDFRVAMRKIARWYNIEVIYNGSVPVNLEAGGWIPRNSKLSDVLKSIESTGQVRFKIEGNKLYVSK